MNKWIIGGGMLVVGALVGIGGYIGYKEWHGNAEQGASKTEQETKLNPNTPPPETAKVVAVLDGITIQLDTGHVIRYIGVDTPNVRDEVQCFGKESVKANESMIGMTVRLEEEPLLDRSKDGAWTRYVFFTPPEEEKSQSPSSNDQTEGSQNDQASPSNDQAPKPNDQGENTSIPEVSPHPSASPAPESSEPKKPDEIFVNERILEGGFGFPIVAQDMKYGERLLSAARYASATGKGLWGQCQKPEEDQTTHRWKTEKVEDCVIKGKVTVDNKKIYRTPECPAYKETVVVESNQDQWFCAEDTAQEQGFTKAPDCK